MPDFRFEGTTIEGKSVQGFVSADNSNEAKSKVRQLAEQHQVKVQRIRRRRSFLYKIQRANEKPLKGEQKAFSKEELKAAFEKLGYTSVSVYPKFLDIKLPPPATEVITFVRLSADLLREKLPFTEVLQLLTNDVQNPRLKEALKEINNDLRQGKDSEEAFLRQEKVLGPFTARMLGIASKSGNMANIYESTAKFLERSAEFKRSLRSALIMPMFTLLVLAGACVFYIAYIFPETAKLFAKLGTELPPMTTATMALSDMIMNNGLAFLTVTLSLAGGLIYLLRTPKGHFLRDKYMIKIPVLGTLIHKSSIEIFCRVFHSLYSGSGENIEAIKLAAEACGNKYMEHQIKTVAIPMMLSQGKGLVQSFEASGVFTRTALARFSSGAETGTIKATALQIASFYEKETVYKLKIRLPRASTSRHGRQQHRHAVSQPHGRASR